MLRTVEAIIDQDWVVRLLEPLRLSTSSRAVVTILDQEIAPDGDESALSDWNRAEEDEAWNDLRQAPESSCGFRSRTYPARSFGRHSSWRRSIEAI